jgi:hypothetical protein
MRKLTLLPILVFAVACEQVPTAPTALDAPDIRASAIPTKTNEIVPIAFGPFVPCANGGAGEVVWVSGNLHINDHVTINDNRVHVLSHYNAQGIQGVGLTTGDTYRDAGATKETFNFFVGVDDFPLTYTYVDNFRIIGPGPGNNLTFHLTFHVTVNANGVVTTVVDNGRFECK